MPLREFVGTISDILVQLPVALKGCAEGGEATNRSAFVAGLDIGEAGAVLATAIGEGEQDASSCNQFVHQRDGQGAARDETVHRHRPVVVGRYLALGAAVGRCASLNEVLRDLELARFAAGYRHAVDAYYKISSEYHIRVVLDCFKTFECAGLFLPVAGLAEWQIGLAVADAVEFEQR